MKKTIILVLLTFIVSSGVTAKVTFKDWMTKSLYSNIKEIKKEKKLNNGVKARNEKVTSDFDSSADSYSDEYDETDKMIDITDPEYEWSQSDAKNACALMTEHGLMLKNKKSELITLSTVDLPFNIDNDEFTYSLNIFLTGKKIDKDCTLGIVFDYEDNRNYKAVIINNSQYSYINIKEGVEHIKDTGLIKLPGHTFVMSIKREGDIIYFSIDDIEYAKLRNVEIKHIKFGVLASGKQEVYIPQFLFDIADKEESEQSTTPY